MTRPNQRTRLGTRREFLTAAGATGVAGLLAGCVSAPGGSGGGGGGGGSISMVIPPLGYNSLSIQYIDEQTDILPNAMDEVGYEYDITLTWEEIAIGAAGQADVIPTMGDIEGARWATQRDVQLTYHGLHTTNYEGIYVRRDSDLDPANTGSVEATFDTVVEEQRLWGNAGWAQGEVPAGQIVIDDQFGYNYAEEGGDFDVRSADWFALPELLIDEEVDIIVNAPPLGAAPHYTGDERPIKDILWYQPGLETAGLDGRTINLGQWVTTQEYSDENEEAIRAMMNAYQEGARWLTNEENHDDILSEEDNVEALGGNNEAESRIILEFGTIPGVYAEAEPSNPYPVALSDFEMSDEFIETSKQALRIAQERGFVDDGWEERIEYKPLSLD